MVDSNLFEMLAQANSQDHGALADAKAAAGALNSIFGGFRAQNEYNRQQKVKDMLDQKVPDDVLERIFGSADALPGGLSLSGLKELGGASLLKDPSADLMSTSLLLSGGDAKKMKTIYDEAKLLGRKPKVNPATIALYKAMKPSDVSSNKDVNALRALQTNLTAQLKGDLSTADEEIVRNNLELVNMKLAGMGDMGGTYKKTPTKPPKTVAPAVSTGTVPSPAPAPKRQLTVKEMKDLSDAILKSISQ